MISNSKTSRKLSLSLQACNVLIISILLDSHSLFQLELITQSLKRCIICIRLPYQCYSHVTMAGEISLCKRDSLKDPALSQRLFASLIKFIAAFFLSLGSQLSALMIPLMDAAARYISFQLKNQLASHVIEVCCVISIGAQFFGERAI